jgi:hypothetical protein
LYIPIEQLLVPVWQRWVARGSRPEPERLEFAEGWRLTYNGRARASAWAYLLLFVVLELLGVFLFLAGPAPDRFAVVYLPFFGALVLLSLYYVGTMYWDFAELTPDGVTQHRFLRSQRFAAWDEIQRVEFRGGDEYIRLILYGGGKVQVSTFFNGLAAVRRCLSRYVGPGVWRDADGALSAEIRGWVTREQDLYDDPFDPFADPER